MTLRFEGGVALAHALDRLSKRVSARVRLEALKEVAEPMRDRMEVRAPVGPDAPHLRDRMVIGASRGQDAKETAVAVGATRGGYYGSFQEFGTSEHAAQPWARPAFDETWRQALSDLSGVLWRELAGRGIQRPMAVDEGPVAGEEV